MILPAAERGEYSIKVQEEPIKVLSASLVPLVPLDEIQELFGGHRSAVDSSIGQYQGRSPGNP